MMNRAKLQTAKTNVSNEDMAYTDRELRDMIVELVDSHIDALNRLQTAGGRLNETDSGFNDPIAHTL